MRLPVLTHLVVMLAACCAVPLAAGQGLLDATNPEKPIVQTIPFRVFGTATDRNDAFRRAGHRSSHQLIITSEDRPKFRFDFWDAPTGQRIARLPNWTTKPYPDIEVVGISPNRQMVVVNSCEEGADAYKQSKLRVIDLKTGAALYESPAGILRVPQPVAVSDDAVVFADSKSMHLWDRKTKSITVSIPIKEPPTALMFLPQNGGLVVAFKGAVQVFGLNPLVLSKTISRPEADHSPAFILLPYGATGRFSLSDGPVGCFDAVKGEFMAWPGLGALPEPGEDAEFVSCGLYLAKRKEFLYGVSSKKLIFRDARKEGPEGELARLDVPHQWPLMKKPPVLSPDEAFIAVPSDGKVTVIDVARRAVVFTLECPPSPELDDRMFPEFSADGKELLTYRPDGVIRHWDLQTGKLKVPLAPGHRAQIGGIVFSLDGSRMISTGSDGAMLAWDTVNCTVLATGNTFAKVCAMDAVGKVYGQTKDYEIAPFDSQTLQPGKSLFNVVIINSLDVQGPWLITAAYEKVLLHNITTNENFQPAQSKHMDYHGAAVAPTGARVAYGEGKEINVIDLTQMTQRGAPAGHTDDVTSVAWSPDGNLLVSGSNDTTVRLWKVEAARIGTAELKGHTNRVECVDFSPDGTQFASGSWDGTVRIWNAITGVSDQILKVTDGHVTVVRFTPNGKFLATGSTDCIIRLWKVK